MEIYFVKGQANKALKYLKASLFLLAVLFVIFGSVLFGNKTLLPIDLLNMANLPMSSHHREFTPFNHFEDDIMRFYYDYKAQAQKYLYKPYWNPYVFGGTPQYAVTYATHFSSTNWILKFGSVERMYCVKLITQLFIAGLGMFFLLSTLEISFWVGLLFAMAYMLNSMFVTLMLREWMTGPFSWVPWFVAVFLKLLKKGSVWNFAWSSLFLALCFTDGFFQSDGAVLILMAALGLTHLFITPGKKQFTRIAALGFGVFVFAFCLSAIMWLPDLEYLRADIAKGSTRIAGIYYGKTITERLLSLPFLVGFLIPELLGSVRTLDFTKLINSNLQDFTGYIGVIPLLFGVTGAFSFRYFSKNSIYFLVLMLMGLIIPILTPLDRYLYFRFFIVHIFGAVVLGAFCMDHFLNGEEKIQNIFRRVVKYATGIYAFAFLVSLTFTLILIAKGQWLTDLLVTKIMKMPMGSAGTIHPQWIQSRLLHAIDYHSLDFSGALWRPLIGFMMFLAFYSLYREQKLKRELFIGFAILLTLADLSRFNYQWLPRNDVGRYPFFEDNSITRYLKNQGQDFRATFLNFEGPSYQEKLLDPNLPAPFKVYALEGFDGMRPAVAVDLVPDFLDYKKLGLFNVGFVVKPKAFPVNNPALHQVFEGEDVLIYKNEYAKPRGYIRYPNEEALDFNVRLTSAKEMSTEYLINSAKPGYFITTETYYPGWRAKVKGIDTSISKENQVLRSVPVGQGQSIVKFEFDPLSYKIGLRITLISLGLFLMMLFWGRRQNARHI